MSWKKYFKPVNSVLPSASTRGTSRGLSNNKYSSWLPEVYAGPSDRLSRYQVYETMDFDHEIHAALDTIADFATENDAQTKQPFVFEYHADPTPTEVTLISKALRQWCVLNEIDKRQWSMFRNTLKYGDQIFIRDPETFKLYWVDPNKVIEVIVNESKGKEAVAYTIKDLDLNIKDSIATRQSQGGRGSFSGASMMFSAPHNGASNFANPSHGLGATDGTFAKEGETMVDAKHIVHLTLCDGMDASWPFGTSILEQVYKVYKQKELIEDSVIIYRVHRAPERRIFYIDVGQMPPNKAKQHLEQVKYDIQQKRIPSRSGGGSSMTDATYNPMCLALDTKIPLLNGEIVKLSEIIERHEAGEELWAYSCHPITGRIAPGIIDWAGITKRNAETITITLDNGKTITCTPEHKFPVLGRGFVCAKDLTEDDSLISHETKYTSLSHDKNRTYQQVYDHETNKWVFTHRLVSEFNGRQFVSDYEYEINEEKEIVHHKNFNRYDNRPENLCWMGRNDHFKYHSAHKKEYWENILPEEADRIKDKIRNSLEVYRETLTEEDRLKVRKKQVKSQIKRYAEFRKDKTRFAKYCRETSERQKEYYQEDSEHISRLKKISSDNLKKNVAHNQEIVFSTRMLSYVVKVVKDGDLNRLETIEALNADDKFKKMMMEDNPLDLKSSHNVKNDVFTEKKLRKMYREYGYDGWKDFKSKVSVYNHRIKSISVSERQDVGTLTIDMHEIGHDYHTFALDAGVYTKNSALEDYYIAVTSEGRGSKVETLPGGENLGSIDDLRYFNNKMMRALGVPSSYLPTGPEDGSASYNDGRVGTAFIQEFRFSKVCQRYQKQIAKVYDKEFKLFLRNKGIIIDNSLFTLCFPEPQSFSEYRQLELDAAKINVFASMSNIPFLSKRFALKRYLGLSEEEIVDNERMWKEENINSESKVGGDAKGDLSAAGITSSGIDGMAPPGGFEDMDDDFADDDFDMDDMGGDDIGDADIDDFGSE